MVGTIQALFLTLAEGWLTSAWPFQSPVNSTGVFPVGFDSPSLPQTLFFPASAMFVGCFYAYTGAVHSTGELRTEQQTLTLSFLAALKALVFF